MRTGYQHMILDDFVQRIRDYRAVREQRLASLKTRADAEAYQAEVREIIAKAFSPFPEESCPLEATISWKRQYDGYTVEGVKFQLRPGYYGTGALYLPDGLDKPAPACLFACGHSLEGKGTDVYQSCCIRLAQNGFVVFASDPVQQGERRQYDVLEDQGQAKDLCGAHNVIDRQLRLLGHSMSSWRVWDNKRALDYLLSRPEVDPTRIGMTGNSGGGTLTEWTWVNDPRLTMAAPSCHVTTFLCNVENEEPTDAEQCPTGVMGAGLEMVDLMFACAPRPVILMGQKYDFFDPRGLKEAYEVLRRFYALFDAEENVQLFIGPCGHGYSSHNQKAMVEFFQKHAGLPASLAEKEPAPVPQQELWVTPTGNVNQDGSTPVYQVIASLADEVAQKRRPPQSAGEWKSTLRELLKMPAFPTEPPHFRILRPGKIGNDPCASFAIEIERNIRAFLMELRPVDGNAFTLEPTPEIKLYLPHQSAEMELTDFAPLRDWNPDGPIYALDPRGMGQSAPEDSPGTSFFQSYGKDYMMNSLSNMFGESYFGRRVYDILRTLELLQFLGAQKIEVMGRGQGGLLAGIAAVFSPILSQIELYDVPHSYREWIDSAVVNWPAASYPQDVLLHFDLPDLYQFLQPRLTIHSYWNSRMTP